jgi:hypothetical protein
MKTWHGYINIIRLTDIQDRPKVFSAVYAKPAEIYATFPEKECGTNKDFYFSERRGPLDIQRS